YLSGRTEGFTLTFWTNVQLVQPKGEPGTALFSEHVGGNEMGTGPFYTYSATLQTPFVAEPGTTYWLSIVADDASPTPQWFWQGAVPGPPGDTHSAQDPSGKQRQFFKSDQAFALSGTPTPEPASLVLLASATAGLMAGWVWRRKRAKP